jgi:PHD/YefM family antitoxin component YafN of YafNO toxin-antitoxin module
VLVAAEDLETIEATLELLSDPEAQKRLQVAEAEVSAGDVLDEPAVRGLVARRSSAHPE